MYDVVLFVLGVALAEVATTTRLRDWSWYATALALALSLVAIAGARRAAHRRQVRDLENARRDGYKKGVAAFTAAGSDELNWFAHALEEFYRRYCVGEGLLAN